MLNIRKIIMRPAAVMLSTVMLVGSSFVSENNIDSATETEGTTYIKHYYNSNKPDEEYTLEPIEYSTEFTLSRSIIVGDPRPTIDPPQSMVAISISNNNGSFSGTGFIIGGNQIMTAAHAVYDADNSSFFNMNSIKITANNVSLTATACHILKDYKTNADYTVTNSGKFFLTSGYVYSDLAIITVEEDLYDYEILDLGLANNNIVSNDTPVHVMGYNFNFIQPNLKLSDGLVKDVSPLNYITTNCYTIGGTSGGPLFTKCIINGIPYVEVIGICSSKINDTSYFAKVTNEVLQFAYRNSHL